MSTDFFTGVVGVDPDNPKDCAWNGLRRAIAEAYPNTPGMADRVCLAERDGVYRFVSQILCANQRRAKRIEELMNALDSIRDELYKISDKAEDALGMADSAIEKVGSASVHEVV